MFFAEKRLAWKNPPESGPAHSETAKAAQDKDPDEGVATTPEEDAQKKAEAQSASATESADASKEADELASSVEETSIKAAPPASQKDKPNETYEWLKKTVGETWATIIAAITSFLGIQIFENKSDATKEAAANMIEATKVKYQAVVTELVSQKKLPDKIVVRDTDPSLLTTPDYNIKTPDELKAFFQDKPIVSITEETGLVDYIDMVKKQSSTMPPSPKTQESTDTDQDHNTNTDILDPSPFDKKPLEEIDLSKPGTCGRFKLKTGEELRITENHMEIGEKKFKVKVKVGLLIELKFSKITPSSQGFAINMGAGLFSKNVQLDEAKIVKLIQGLYQKKGSQSFEQTVSSNENETYMFRFIAT